MTTTTTTTTARGITINADDVNLGTITAGPASTITASTADITTGFQSRYITTDASPRYTWTYTNPVVYDYTVNAVPQPADMVVIDQIKIKRRIVFSNMYSPPLNKIFKSDDGYDSLGDCINECAKTMNSLGDVDHLYLWECTFVKYSNNDGEWHMYGDPRVIGVITADSSVYFENKRIEHYQITDAVTEQGYMFIGSICDGDQKYVAKKIEVSDELSEFLEGLSG